MLQNIPQELRAYSSFVLWRYEERGDGKKATKVPYSVTGYPANVNNPGTWTDYKTAVSAFQNGGDRYSGIGFVLSEADPFAFIDLDDAYDETKGYTPEQSQAVLERQIKIHDMFNSFSERSPSGKGLHILCKGAVSQGRKRAQIEVYSTQRFMTVTGDVFNGAPIEERHELLNELWSEMGRDIKVFEDVQDQPSTKTDDEVCQQAHDAVNGAKFLDLFNGHWSHYYSSQSEADFALIDIVAFYTQNHAQISRIFRSSALGQREKAFRDDYVGYMINRAMDHQLPPINLEALRINLEAALAARQLAQNQAQAEADRIRSDNVTRSIQHASDMQTLPGYAPQETPVTTLTPPRYPVPPGLLGEIAQFIEAAAPRPVYEIALVGAIGLMSGITGRAYNISATGLNQYTLLIAPTGSGKEAIGSGIDRLMTAVQMVQPNCKQFIGPGDISSAQALGKHFHRHSKSFVAMPGEIGLWLQRICGPFAGPADVGVMRAMLQLYSSSGQGQTYKGTINSQKENSTEDSLAPAFSVLGESTPEQFYKILDDSMISSGLLPRFNIFEYLGERPKRNRKAAHAEPSPGLIDRLAALVTNAHALNETNRVVNVRCTDDADKLLNDWDEHCDAEHRRGSSDVSHQFWNRGHLRALKLAALVAVGCHAYQPVIDYQCAEWAITIINDDIKRMLSRYEAGEIGSDNSESQQIVEIVRMIREYLVKPYGQLETYQIDVRMHAERIIPYAYLQKRLSSSAAFRADQRVGATGAIKRAIQILLDRGDIAEVPRGEIKTKFDTVSRAFAVTAPKIFV